VIPDIPLRLYTRDADDRVDLTVVRVPLSTSHPYHGQVKVIEPTDARTQVGLPWYAPQEAIVSDAVWFDEGDRDPFGMPAPRVRFALPPSEIGRARSAEVLVRQLAGPLGAYAPHGQVALLPPDSSLHCLGTVPMGARDDGAFVCDATGRVCGLANLFVAGNGVIPGPTACNPTLTSLALAVLCGDEVLRLLDGGDGSTAALLAEP